MRVAFLGSPPFATPILQALIEGGFPPVAVVTQPDRPRGRGQKLEPGAVRALAERHAIPVLQPESTRDPAFALALRAARPDALLVASYGEILREDVLALAPLGAFNVHASLLPRWRGASPIQQVLLHGEPETGVTIQRMVRALDAGDIVLQRRLAVSPEETAGELAGRLAALGAEAALEALAQIESGQARFEPQDPARVTVCRKLDKHAGHIDWSRSALELERFVRAMNPWPLARGRLGELELALLRARALAPADPRAPRGALPRVPTAPAAAVPLDTSASSGANGAQAGAVARALPPGTLLEAGPRLVVACGEGALELLELQAAGRRPLDSAGFLRGARLAPGQCFEPPRGAA